MLVNAKKLMHKCGMRFGKIQRADVARCYHSGISHMSMHPLLVISALILSVSPAFADEIIYLKCNVAIEMK